jgi:hypothetical protein
MRIGTSIFAILAAAILFPVAAAGAVDDTCGYGPSDWCTTEKDGACGRHKDALSCRSDRACRGMQYRGESVVACHWDETGYADNCPTVGCLDR